jgi:sarcosine oxidase subunit gamma
MPLTVMHRHQVLMPSAPFEGVIPGGNAQGDVIVHRRDGLGLASVLARKGQTRALAQRVREHCGIELPQGPRRAAAGDLAFVGTAPASWLAVHESAGNALVSALRAAFSDLACISDQSDAYGVLRLSGRRVREALAKLVPIDVHERAFAIGGVAATVAGHIAVTLWRLDDNTEGWPVFEIAVPRSFTESFRRAVSASVAHPGL